MIIPGSQAIQSEKSLIALLTCISTEIASNSYLAVSLTEIASYVAVAIVTYLISSYYKIV